MGNSVVHKKLLYRVEYSDYYNRTSQIWLPVDIAPGSELYQQLLAYQAGNLGDEGLARHLLSYHFNRDFSGDGAHWDYNGQIVERVPTISVVRIDDTVESEGESNNDFNFEDTDEDNIVSENKDEGNEENSSNEAAAATGADSSSIAAVSDDDQYVVFDVRESSTWDWKDIYATAEAKAQIHINKEAKWIRLKDYKFYCSG